MSYLRSAMIFLFVVVLGSFSNIVAADTRNCSGIWNNYFNSIVDNNSGRYVANVYVTTNSLWPNGNAFSSFSRFTAYPESGNVLVGTGGFQFSDRNNFNGKKDNQTFYLYKNGSMKVTLDSWGGRALGMALTHCERMSSDAILLQARGAGGRGNNIYNLTLTKGHYLH
ncbi:MAG: hypothetical protein R3F02_16700 [Thiolinea sp.]